jgi:uncharacterized phage-associated protein
MKPVDLAYYVVDKCHDVTPLKLQKLMFYLKVWGVVSGDDIVDGNFEKWKFGPVNAEVYNAFKKYESKTIAKNLLFKHKAPAEKKPFIDFVLECYDPFDALTLSSMTHAEDPWQQTGYNQVITEESIKKYYSKLPFAKNFPYNPDTAFYPVQTNMYHAFIMDMSKDEAEKLTVYPSFKVYKEQVKEAQKQTSGLLSQLAKQ